MFQPDSNHLKLLVLKAAKCILAWNDAGPCIWRPLVQMCCWRQLGTIAGRGILGHLNLSSYVGRCNMSIHVTCICSSTLQVKFLRVCPKLFQRKRFSQGTTCGQFCEILRPRMNLRGPIAPKPAPGQKKPKPKHRRTRCVAGCSGMACADATGATPFCWCRGQLLLVAVTQGCGRPNAGAAAGRLALLMEPGEAAPGLRQPSNEFNMLLKGIHHDAPTLETASDSNHLHRRSLWF